MHLDMFGNPIEELRSLTRESLNELMNKFETSDTMTPHASDSRTKHGTIATSLHTPMCLSTTDATVCTVPCSMSS